MPVNEDKYRVFKDAGFSHSAAVTLANEDDTSFGGHFGGGGNGGSGGGGGGDVYSGVNFYEDERFNDASGNLKDIDFSMFIDHRGTKFVPKPDVTRSPTPSGATQPAPAVHGFAPWWGEAVETTYDSNVAPSAFQNTSFTELGKVWGGAVHRAEPHDASRRMQVFQIGSLVEIAAALGENPFWVTVSGEWEGTVNGSADTLDVLETRSRIIGVGIVYDAGGADLVGPYLDSNLEQRLDLIEPLGAARTLPIAFGSIDPAELLATHDAIEAVVPGANTRLAYVQQVATHTPDLLAFKSTWNITQTNPVNGRIGYILPE